MQLKAAPVINSKVHLKGGKFPRVFASKASFSVYRTYQPPNRATKSEGTSGTDDKKKPSAAVEEKSDEYSETMQKKMGTTLTYTHEDGMNYNRIIDDLIVGSCLQTPDDVDFLAEKEGVTTILCLQEDSDMEYFNLDVNPIIERCNERGDVKHVRFTIRDFDPFDLRLKLPKAVSRLAREHRPGVGTVYIHCTAGLGRAPAVALAYMTWLRGFQLDNAFKQLRGERMCSPRLEAIRSATADLLLGVGPVESSITLRTRGVTGTAQVAGLDFGWHQKLDMELDKEKGRYILHRTLLPGRYTYKYVIDDVWTYSADHPTISDGNNVNNVLDVVPANMDPVKMAKQMRFLSTGGDLTEGERQELHSILCPWSTHSSSQ